MMIERKIRPGMLLEFPLPVFAAYVDTGSFMQPVPTLRCHIWREGKDDKAVRGISRGALDRQGHRNFAWLPWRPGYVTYTLIDDNDILSGPFTGCRYMLCAVNGVRQVYHIGTHEAQDTPQSLRAKRAMHAHISDPDVDYIGGFSPAETFQPLPQVAAGDTTEVCGLITPGGDFFSILFQKTISADQLIKHKKTVLDVQPGHPITRAAALAFFNV